MWSKVGAIFVRDARLALSYRMNFWLQWVSIAVSVAGFYFISQLVPPSHHFGFKGRVGTYFEYVIVGLAFVNFQGTALQSFQKSIRGDQMLGTLESILATPTSLPLIILSAGVWAFFLTTLQVACYLTLAAVFFGLDLDHVNLLSAGCFLVLTIACMSPLGVMGAATVMTFKQAGPSNFVMGGAAQLLSGVLFPVSLLPIPLQWVSQALPLTHALRGMRGAVHGASIVQLAPDIIWLGIATLVLLPTSLFIFGRAVERAKMDGTLGHY
jgi:ABC-2 type transport system permease protein